jgi:rSAM-associated Gly-rich repeat protein
MSAKKRTLKVLALLIPTGVIGISSALASTRANTNETSSGVAPASVAVAERLSNIRSAVSSINNTVTDNASGAKFMLAEWLNFRGGGLGWHNGGWGNGGWHNGGWHNGGWHNGGWGNGWHNGGWHNWHNFWRNW